MSVTQHFPAHHPHSIRNQEPIFSVGGSADVVITGDFIIGRKYVKIGKFERQIGEQGAMESGDQVTGQSGKSNQGGGAFSLAGICDPRHARATQMIYVQIRDNLLWLLKVQF